MKIRRVVTGHDDEGKAVFVDDQEVEPITVSLTPEAEYHRLWGANELPTFPDDGVRPADEPFFPPVGGHRFLVFAVPPGHRQEVGSPEPTPEELAFGMEELERKLPGLRDHMEPDAPGMHTTASIDFELVLEGEVWLELDDGAEVHLKPGDTVVQNGTRHAWRNKGTETARLVAVLIGAHHGRVTTPPADVPPPWRSANAEPARGGHSRPV